MVSELTKPSFRGRRRLREPKLTALLGLVLRAFGLE
jgi:hypothetical protein